VTGRVGAEPPGRRRRVEPLGRRGLIVGVAVLVVIAAIGGTSLLRSSGRTAAGVDAALAPFPGFPPATPGRQGPGVAGDVAAAYVAIAAQGTADWRTQFARAGVDWADPAWPPRAPAVPVPGRRARLVFDVGTHLGDWAQQLIGIPGLLEVARRQHRISAGTLHAETADLVACLAGVWGRSMISTPDLAAAAPSGQAVWVVRGAQTGVPASCAPAAGG
jgi:hypothetical protein